MDLSTYREGWAARRAREAAQAQLARTSARDRLPQLVALLVDDFKADGVILIGSLARGDFRPDSDIDLVVRGLPVNALFKAGAALDRHAGRHVDLIPFEDATPSLHETITREGEVLHGAF